jgi:nicotinamidase-related amidase
MRSGEDKRQHWHKEGDSAMVDFTYRRDATGLVVVDPYNDFISEGGIVWPRVREVVEANQCVAHMIQLLNAARSAGLRILFAPHHRWRAGDYETWTYLAPTQELAARSHVFADGTWGGTFRDELTPLPGEIVASEHWCSSGFANTDLDLQLKKHGVHHVIVIGLLANTCIDSTVRYAAELGYAVTLVKDAIGSRSWDEMKATLEVNAPNYARAIVSTQELIATFLTGATVTIGRR